MSGQAPAPDRERGQVAAQAQETSSMHRDHLAQAINKLAPGFRRGSISLYAHEADAVWRELGRLANFATLLGSPSSLDVAGLDDRGHTIECDGTKGCLARKHVRCFYSERAA